MIDLVDLLIAQYSEYILGLKVNSQDIDRDKSMMDISVVEAVRSEVANAFRSVLDQLETSNSSLNERLSQLFNSNREGRSNILACRTRAITAINNLRRIISAVKKTAEDSCFIADQTISQKELLASVEALESFESLILPDHTAKRLFKVLDSALQQSNSPISTPASVQAIEEAVLTLASNHESILQMDRTILDQRMEIERLKIKLATQERVVKYRFTTVEAPQPKSVFEDKILLKILCKNLISTEARLVSDYEHFLNKEDMFIETFGTLESTLQERINQAVTQADLEIANKISTASGIFKISLTNDFDKEARLNYYAQRTVNEAKDYFALRDKIEETLSLIEHAKYNYNFLLADITHVKETLGDACREELSNKFVHPTYLEDLVEIEDRLVAIKAIIETKEANIKDSFIKNTLYGKFTLQSHDNYSIMMNMKQIADEVTPPDCSLIDAFTERLTWLWVCLVKAGQPASKEAKELQVLLTKIGSKALANKLKGRISGIKFSEIVEHIIPPHMDQIFSLFQLTESTNIKSVEIYAGEDRGLYSGDTLLGLPWGSGIWKGKRNFNFHTFVPGEYHHSSEHWRGIFTPVKDSEVRIPNGSIINGSIDLESIGNEHEPLKIFYLCAPIPNIHPSILEIDGNRVKIDDGSSYSGLVMNGVPHSEGTANKLILADGRIYENRLWMFGST